MSTFKADRVQETGTGSGTGAITLAGSPPTGYKTFSGAGIADGQLVTAFILDQATNAWEISICTYAAAGGTLTRTTFRSASSGSTFFPFATGTKTVALVPSALDVVTSDTGLNWAARIDVASAATCAIGAAAGNLVRITGTTGITAFDTPAAACYRFIEFQGAVAITHAGATLNIGGGASVTTTAGQLGLAIYEGSSLWNLWLFPAGPAAAADVSTGTDTAKFLNSKVVFDAAAMVSVAYAATITLDLTTGLNFEIAALTGNLTLANPSAGMTPGRSGSIGLLQDGTGSRTLTLGSQWKHVGGAPALSTAASTQDTLFYEVIDSTHIRCSLAKAFA